MILCIIYFDIFCISVCYLKILSLDLNVVQCGTEAAIRQALCWAQPGGPKPSVRPKQLAEACHCLNSEVFSVFSPFGRPKKRFVPIFSSYLYIFLHICSCFHLFSWCSSPQKAVYVAASIAMQRADDPCLELVKQLVKRLVEGMVMSLRAPQIWAA